MKWDEIKRYSKMSDSGLHRHVLSREWDATKKATVLVGLNPSTADSSTEDPTTKKLIKILNNNGYGAFAIVNLFDCITPNPDLINESDVDYSYLRRLLAMFPDVDVIFMWGARGNRYDWNIREVKDICYTRDVYCFGKTKDGQPKHPLYLKDNTKLERYEY